jgi:ABC-type amino acid transport substrate-binding protein
MWQSLLCLVLSSCAQYDTDVLRGKEIHVTSIVAAPYLTHKADGGAQYEGYMVDLLDAVADILGCRFVIKEVADGRYGTSNEGGVAAVPGGRGHLQAEWNGMIGEVMRGDADLAVADLTVTPQRALAVDFSQPILDNGLVAVASHQVAGRSVEDLAARDDLTFLVTAGGATSKFFQNTVDPTHKKIAEKIR